ncbi:tRNA glutamyl-Q(34) synthetase GluQRS [Candidatus Albibeggiatoa sp. nov. NOAA]|uniref:tRNA glutamyl-Q(34) synthetase GluQRS n=1 Tax=Candidatus Albibeggiatoa sp. nov. NOAA TaxID=3162724 RepID=UPI0032FC0B0A|nr:tRNA glutamyl-Q(34) synthetase GluQRS [Thiotrichaceae bacterium]
MYIGRFAPSPTGSLHFGSLVTAVGSYLHARQQDGRWLVRIEDLDTPRVVKGADKAILSTLHRFGMDWDGEIIYQSQRQRAYQDALDSLISQQLIYPCTCTRQRLKGKIYDGYCRNNPSTENQPYALRVKVNTPTLQFSDHLQGMIQQNMLTDIGDFIVKRKDGLFAYQLAVVVDDAEQGVTDVVRGCDLLDTTTRQLYLQQLLDYPCPKYTHLPIMMNADGLKLSKQNHAPIIDDQPVLPLLHQAITILGQNPPKDLRYESMQIFWDWAIDNWCLENVPLQAEIKV